MTLPSVSGEFRTAPVTPRPRFATDVPGAVSYTGQSRAQLYKDMRSGLLRAYKNGARTIIFFDDLDLYLRALPRAKFKPLEEADVNAEARDAQPTVSTPNKSDDVKGRGSEVDVQKSESHPRSGDVG